MKVTYLIRKSTSSVVPFFLFYFPDSSSNSSLLNEFSLRMEFVHFLNFSPLSISTTFSISNNCYFYVNNCQIYISSLIFIIEFLL